MCCHQPLWSGSLKACALPPSELIDASGVEGVLLPTSVKG
uniref:Uncharacterized protein n=1 Tax=Arundo donax TaxID=35708 RepID=A0A0A9B427_ARUDO